MRNIRPLRNEIDYEWALAEIEGYFEDEPVPGSTAADRFDVLAALIENYESHRWPVEAADPIDAIRFVMEATGRTRDELAEILGTRSRVTEVLSGKRRLTMRMAYDLHRKWHIPAAVLLQPPDVAEPAAE